MKRILLYIYIIVVNFQISANAEPNLMEKANQLYEKKDYQSASILYEQQNKQGECVALYYKKNTKVKGVDCMSSCDCYIYYHDKLEPSAVKQMMVTAGSDVTIHSVIRSSTGEILGVVCLDYCSEKYDNFFKVNSAILISELNNCRDRLQAVLRGYNENRPH